MTKIHFLTFKINNNNKKITENEQSSSKNIQNDYNTKGRLDRLFINVRFKNEHF